MALERDASPYNLKRGRGGTLDIEFLVQMLQLRDAAAARPEVLTRNTQAALAALGTSGILSAQMAGRLSESYRFLRRIESTLHLLGAVRRHDLPSDTQELGQLASCLDTAIPTVFASNASIFSRKTVRRSRSSRGNLRWQIRFEQICPLHMPAGRVGIAATLIERCKHPIGRRLRRVERDHVLKRLRRAGQVAHSLATDAEREPILRVRAQLEQLLEQPRRLRQPILLNIQRRQELAGQHAIARRNRRIGQLAAPPAPSERRVRALKRQSSQRRGDRSIV